MNPFVSWQVRRDDGPGGGVSVEAALAGNALTMHETASHHLPGGWQFMVKVCQSQSDDNSAHKPKLV
jgi:hypothetical protein